MKLFMGFIIFLVALVAVTGCTQPATTPAEVTTVPTTEATTIATTVVTTVETTVPSTTATIVANVTAPVANVTTVATETPVNVTPTVTAANQVTTIHITSAGFTPQTDIVLPGTGIIWVNDDTVVHGVKATGDNAGMFNSGDILPKSQFSFSFSEKTGTYTYALIENSTVTGTIIVKSGRTLTG
ncbi:MAG TPA: hypothetical protein PKM50_02780 [Methanoregula sp.]|nr:hypothetical protein [Methanoregula sp.]